MNKPLQLGTDNDPVVFVTQEPWPDRETGLPVRDFTPAQKYGRLKILLAHDVEPATGLELMEALLDAGLDSFKPGDSLILSGHPATIGAAVALVTRFHGPVRLLIWKGRTRSYDPIDLDLSELDGD